MYENLINQKVIARSYDAGVFYGVLADFDGNVARLTRVRQLWYWSGAASLMQLANEGVKNPDNCKFTVPVSEVVISRVCEILPTTETAQQIIEAVREWRS